jgi:hypothetical protein
MSEHKLNIEKTEAWKERWKYIKQLQSSKGNVVWYSSKHGTFEYKKVSKKGQVL